LPSSYDVKDNNKRLKRKIEKWDGIIRQLGLDISKPVNYITAKQIKQVSNEEPRLMAKIDTIERLPTVFRQNNLFLLPVSRKEYAIVKGTGYHIFETVIGKPITYFTSIQFPSSVKGIASENAYLEYAKSCGLLEKLTSTNNLFLTFTGRRTTPRFNFIVNSTAIEVNRAQIEVDAMFESQNPEQIFLFEAKVGTPSSFRVQQLYYPYRTLTNRKPVRNFFFYFEPKQKIYLFWEYEFHPPGNFDSIKLIRSSQYQIKITKSTSVRNYQRVSSDKSKTSIPQADDVNKIIQFPIRVSEGYDTSKKMIDALGFVIRQSSYYRQAAEILGLIISEDNYRYKLTDRGEEFLKLPAEKRASFICKLLLEFPIMNSIFIDISTDRNRTVTKQEIIQLLKKKSHLTGSTLERRARTIRSWFRWIRNNLGLVEVDAAGNIRIDRQTRLA
jgi:hypothetical protein